MRTRIIHVQQNFFSIKTKGNMKVNIIKSEISTAIGKLNNIPVCIPPLWAAANDSYSEHQALRMEGPRE
jgi:hypothetical protein